MKTQTTDERCEELRKNIKLLENALISNSAGDNKELREHHVFNFGRQSGLLEGNEEGRLSAISDVFKKKIIWANISDNSITNDSDLSYEDVIKQGDVEVEIWMVDTVEGVLGDDWDDAPWECNAGQPYKDKCKGLIILKGKIGRELKQEIAKLKESK